MEPLLTMCMASWSAKYEDFLFQMQNSAYFVEVLCKNHFLGKCLDLCFMDCVYFIHVHVIIGYLDVCMIFFKSNGTHILFTPTTDTDTCFFNKISPKSITKLQNYGFMAR